MRIPAKGRWVLMVKGLDAPEPPARITPPASPFHSHLVNTLQAKMPPKMPAEHLSAMLTKPDSGINQEELHYSGLPDLLKQRAGAHVTRDEVLNHVQQNLPQIKPIVHGPPDESEVALWWNDEGGANEETPWNALAPHEREQAMREYRQNVGRWHDDDSTRYDAYTLPGGENYQEHLLTLPSRADAKRTGFLRGGVPLTENSYVSAHWDQPNVMAHVRTNERETPTYTPDQISDIGERLRQATGARHESSLGSGAPQAGVRQGVITPLEAAQYAHAKGFPHNDTTGALDRAMHIEEIQSDWHQQGRKHGYKLTPEEFEAEHTRLDKEWLKANQRRKDAYAALRGTDAGSPDVGRLAAEAVDADKAEIQATDNLNLLNDRNRDGAPEAPWKNEWPNLAFKYALRRAAERGHNRVTWTTGEDQAERYNLANRIKSLHYYPETQTLHAAHNAPRANATSHHNVAPEKLADYVGKDVAERLLAQEPDEGGGHSLYGVDLKMGGEGMRGFYDRTLPNIARDLGKPFGAQVGQMQIRTPRKGIEHGGDTFDRLAVERLPDGRFGVVGVNDDAGERRVIQTFNHPYEAQAELQNMQYDPRYAAHEAHTVHYMTIPDAMREHILREGVPMWGKFRPANTLKKCIAILWRLR